MLGFINIFNLYVQLSVICKKVITNSMSFQEKSKCTSVYCEQYWTNILLFLLLLQGIIIITVIVIRYPRRVYRDLPVCTFVRAQTASPLYKFYFLTDCHETSHTCSQTSSLVRVRKWASQVTCNPPIIGGFRLP